MTPTEPVKRFTPQEIVAKLGPQFERARESGDLLFFPSTVHKHTDVGVDVRFPPSVLFHNSNSQFPGLCFCRMPIDHFSVAV